MARPYRCTLTGIGAGAGGNKERGSTLRGGKQQKRLRSGLIEEEQTGIERIEALCRTGQRDPGDGGGIEIDDGQAAGAVDDGGMMSVNRGHVASRGNALGGAGERADGGRGGEVAGRGARRRWRCCRPRRRCRRAGSRPKRRRKC